MNPWAMIALITMRPRAVLPFPGIMAKPEANGRIRVFAEVPVTRRFR